MSGCVAVVLQCFFDLNTAYIIIDVGLVGRLVLRRARTSRHLRGDAANLVRQPDGFLVKGERPLEGLRRTAPPCDRQRRRPAVQNPMASEDKTSVPATSRVIN